ncbi:hypothetical protein V5T82_09400 [Magnetovibrio sp. PR-2]|uniref:hypothetical protein n=1 Tax=Magnetovibrio sp. PR-2 TaxID=3120356 RepID=UPI002FCE1170
MSDRAISGTLGVMNLSQFHPTRRKLIRTLLMGACLSPALMAVLKAGSAAQQEPITQGFQTVDGDVRLNGRPAQVGMVVRPTDVCTTGADGSCVIIIGEHVFLLRENAEVEFEVEHFEEGFDTSRTVTQRIRVAAGALLGGFANTQATIDTPLATIGIRGTGLYVEAHADRDYVCLCYGKAELHPKLKPSLVQHLDTFHHETPRNLFADPLAHGGRVIAPEKMINHQDEELIMLEALVGRIPLFGPEPIKMPS